MSTTAGPSSPNFEYCIKTKPQFVQHIKAIFAKHVVLANLLRHLPVHEAGTRRITANNTISFQGIIFKHHHSKTDSHSAI
jgi:hypothetical protein